MPDTDWPWTDAAEPAEASDGDALASACARLFATADGRRLLAYLDRATRGIALGPAASEARLRHLEGQRALVLSLHRLAARGGLSPLPPLI